MPEASAAALAYSSVDIPAATGAAGGAAAAGAAGAAGASGAVGAVPGAGSPAISARIDSDRDPLFLGFGVGGAHEEFLGHPGGRGCRFGVLLDRHGGGSTGRRGSRHF